VKRLLIPIIAISLLTSCGNTGETGKKTSSDSQPAKVGSDFFDLSDIQTNGELIIITLFGDASYFEFRGEDFGTQYMLAREYAKSIGTRIRVEVAKDKADLVRKLRNGEGDVIAYNIGIDDSLKTDFVFCGRQQISHFMDSLSVVKRDTTLRTDGNTAWVVRKDAPQLASSLQEWLAANENDFFDYTTIRVKGKGGKTYAPRRKVKSPMLDQARGIISEYDAYFKQYGRQCGWDWRLLAAQAFQESGFDPQAVSFMGAMGLMQLMPRTAADVGVSQSEVFNPESNIRGATRLISKLNTHYSFIHNPQERINFILAAYNAGPGHVDDARNLAERYGKNPDVWHGNVDEYVLKMAQSEFFNLPGVKHGYFRGSETYDYVEKILSRWDEYKRKVR